MKRRRTHGSALGAGPSAWRPRPVRRLVANNPVQARQSRRMHAASPAIADASTGSGRPIPGGGRAAARRTRPNHRLRPVDRLRTAKFLFFGSAPPPQCGEINAQIGRMRANLEELQRAREAAGAAISSRATMRNAPIRSRPTNFLSALFGGGARTTRSTAQPLRSGSPPRRGEAARRPTRAKRKSRRMPAPRPSACARATAASSRSPIPRRGRAAKPRGHVPRLCPNADMASTPIPFRARSSRRCRSRRALYGIAQRR